MFSILTSSLLFIHQLMSAAAQICIIMQAHMCFYHLIQKTKNEMISMQQGENDINLPRAYFLILSIICYSAVAWPLPLSILILSGIRFNLFSIGYTISKLGKNTKLSQDEQALFNKKWIARSYLYFGLASILYIIGLFVFPANTTAILPRLISFIIGLDPIFWLTGLQFGVLGTFMHSIFFLLNDKVRWFSELNAKIEPYLSAEKNPLFWKNLNKFSIFLITWQNPHILIPVIIGRLLTRLQSWAYPFRCGRTFKIHNQSLSVNQSSCKLDDLKANEENGSTLINLCEINSPEFEKKITSLISESPYQATLSAAFIRSELVTEKEIKENQKTLALALLNSALKKLSAIVPSFGDKYGRKETLNATINFKELIDATNILKSKIVTQEKAYYLLSKASAWAVRADQSEKATLMALPKSSSLHLLYAGVLITGLKAIKALPAESAADEPAYEQITATLDDSDLSWDVCPEKAIQDFETLLYKGSDSLEVMMLKYFKSLHAYTTPSEESSAFLRDFLYKKFTNYRINSVAADISGSFSQSLYNSLCYLGLVEGLDVRAHNYAANYSVLNFNLIDGSRNDTFEKDIKDKVLTLNFVGMYHSKDIAALAKFSAIDLSSEIFDHLFSIKWAQANDLLKQENGPTIWQHSIRDAHILEPTYLLAFRNTLNSLLGMRTSAIDSCQLDDSSKIFLEKTSIEVDLFAQLHRQESSPETNIEDNLKALISKFDDSTDRQLSEASQAVAPFNFYLISPAVITQQLQKTKDLFESKKEEELKKAQMELMCRLIGQELILQQFVAKKVLSVSAPNKPPKAKQVKSIFVKWEAIPLILGVLVPPKTDKLGFISNIKKKNGRVQNSYRAKNTTA